MMKPATVAPLPRPKLPATRLSAIEEARCSAETRVRLRTWFAVVASPNPAPPTAEQAKACQGRPANAKARVAQCAREIAGDQDRLGTETIEQRTPKGGVTTAAVPMTAASTSPAVAVGKPRAWCR